MRSEFFEQYNIIRNVVQQSSLESEFFCFRLRKFLLSVRVNIRTRFMHEVGIFLVQKKKEVGIFFFSEDF